MNRVSRRARVFAGRPRRHTGCTSRRAPAWALRLRGCATHSPGLAPGASTPLATKYTLEPSSLDARDQVQHIRAASRFIRRQIGQPPAQRFAGLARDFELVQVRRGFFADRFLARFFAQPRGVGEEHARPVAGGGLEMHELVAFAGFWQHLPAAPGSVAPLPCAAFSLIVSPLAVSRRYRPSSPASLQNTRLPSLEIASRAFRPAARRRATVRSGSSCAPRAPIRAAR